MSDIVNIVESLVKPILDSYKFKLINIEFVKEGKSWYLRVFIDKDGGISIDDCALVSDQLSLKLDEVDPIDQAYYLEVSSPGAERSLNNDNDYELAIGNYIHVSLYQPINNNKIYEGILLEFNQDELIINDQSNEKEYRIRIPRKKIAKARLAIKF